MAKPMKRRDWKTLTRDINRGRCILVLGPNIAQMKKGSKWEPIHERLAMSLAEELEEEEIKYSRDKVRELHYIGMKYLHIENMRLVDLGDEAQDFYERNTREIPPIYTELAKLPFSLVLNVSPDNYMHRALIEEGKQSNLYHYNYQRERKPEIGEVSADKPVVYNVVGKVGDFESMILTEGQRTTFAENVNRDAPPIPSQILEKCDSQKTYLFLGFNISESDWHLVFMLRTLGIQESNTTFFIQENETPLFVREYYSDQFNFQFKIQEEPDSFISELQERVSSAEMDEDDAPKIKTQRVFLAFADKDEAFALDLVKYLKPLESSQYIKLWYKDEDLIDFDEDMDEAIVKNLMSADIVLMLLSADFLFSEEINERELKIALDLEAVGRVRIFPVLARDCAYKYSPIAKFDALILPRNKMAINGSHWTAKDDAYRAIVDGLAEQLGINT